MELTPAALEALLNTGVAIVLEAEKVEPILVGAAKAVLAAFTSHAAASFSEIQAEALAGEIAARAAIKP